MKIQNSIAVISGGSSGIGAETAHFLSNAGAKVAILDVNKEAGEKIANKINGLYVFCDVTDENSAEQAFKNITTVLGPPRICINCAGIAPAKRMVGMDGPMPLGDFKKVIDINLIGTFNTMRLAASVMAVLSPMDETNERGVIINTASIAAYEGQIGQVAYSASKAGICGMTLPAARELAQFGIRVVTIAPGLIHTPLFDGLSEAVRDSLAANIPFPKRLGYPREYASLAAHIIENPLLNGEVIRLDGGLRLPPK